MTFTMAAWHRGETLVPSSNGHAEQYAASRMPVDYRLG